MSTIDSSIPVPVRPCEGCNGTIWRQGDWFQCPDCGMLSTVFGGCYPNLGLDGKPCGAVTEFKAAVEAVKNSDKPQGTFKCSVCKTIWDGVQLMRDPSKIGCPVVCGDPFCGAGVIKLSDEAKNYVVAACYAIALTLFSNEDLAALNYAVQTWGSVDVTNRAYKSALAADMIRADGKPIELEELQSACAFEVNRRVAEGLFE